MQGWGWLCSPLPRTPALAPWTEAPWPPPRGSLLPHAHRSCCRPQALPGQAHKSPDLLLKQFLYIPEEQLKTEHVPGASRLQFWLLGHSHKREKINIPFWRGRRSGWVTKQGQEAWESLSAGNGGQALRGALCGLALCPDQTAPFCFLLCSRLLGAFACAHPSPWEAPPHVPGQHLPIYQEMSLPWGTHLGFSNQSSLCQPPHHGTLCVSHYQGSSWIVGWGSGGCGLVRLADPSLVGKPQDPPSACPSIHMKHILPPAPGIQQ